LGDSLLTKKNGDKIVPAEPPSQDITPIEDPTNATIEESFSFNSDDFDGSISSTSIISKEPLTPPRSPSKQDESCINVNIEKYPLLMETRGDNLVGAGFACVTMVFGLVVNRVWNRTKI
jgi:hypothetical protein